MKKQQPCDSCSQLLLNTCSSKKMFDQSQRKCFEAQNSVSTDLNAWEFQGQTKATKWKVRVFLEWQRREMLQQCAGVKVLNSGFSVLAPPSLLHFPFYIYIIPRNTHSHKHLPLSMPPTFIPIIGADREYGEAYIGILVHINFIGCLCKLWLVIVHITDKNANICCVWKIKKRRVRDTERERGERQLQMWGCSHSVNMIATLDSNNLVLTFHQHARTHIHWWN